MIKKNITQAIKNQNWLAIEYKNKEGKITNYWIAIKDLSLNYKSFSVSAFNMSKSTETHDGLIEIEVFFNGILKANVIRNTSYVQPFDLVSKIESNKLYIDWLNFDSYNDALLDYIYESIINEETPYQTETTLIRGLDQPILEQLKEQEKYKLSYEQINDLVPKLEVLSKQESKRKYRQVTLTLNMLSIVTKKGLYVVAYKEVSFNPIEKSLIVSKETKFNYTFATDTSLSYKHNLRNYLDVDTDDFITLFLTNPKLAKDILEPEVLKHKEYLDDKPYIMDLNRMFDKHIEQELDSIKLKKKNESLSTPLKSFFGNMSKNLLTRNKREVNVVLIDDKVNIDQLRVIYNALTQPITFVQGPPGTGKTQTIINTLISSFFNDDKVLVTSNNNKPINDIFSKLTSFKSRNHEIFFPFIRLGNNEETINSLNNVKRILKRVDKLKVEEHKLENHYKTSKEEMKEINKILSDYEKIVEVEEELDVLKSIEKNIQNNLRSTSISGLLNLRQTERDSYPKETPDITKLIKQVDPSFLSWLAFTGVKHYKRMFEPKNEELLNIINLEDDDKKIREFNMYLKNEENFNNFQRIFPIILTTNHSAHKLGIQKESFNLTIIDEAGQSTLGHSLFAIARARRLLLVGDQNQLKPVVTMAAETNQILMKKHNITSNYDYLKNSILLSMQKSDTLSKFVLLRYHYRCHKDIIEFSNKKYYHGQLVVPIKQNLQNNALEHINVSTKDDPKSLTKNTSFKEVDAIIRDLKEKNYVSVGIITPFRNQADTLKIAVDEAGLSNVTVGTVHTFQGDEKDVIYFSSGITSSTHETSFNWVKNNQELINVATTRAKKKLIIVSDTEEIKTRSEDLNNDFFELQNYVIKNGKEVTLNPSTETYFINGANFKSYDTKKEEEFFSTINHLLSTADKYVLKNKIRVASIFNEFKSEIKFDYGLKSEFDLVIFKQIGKNLIPVVIIELDGQEHYSDEKVIKRDRLKESICRDNGIELIRIDNKYSRRYLHIKDLLRHILV